MNQRQRLKRNAEARRRSPSPWWRLAKQWKHLARKRRRERILRRARGEPDPIYPGEIGVIEGVRIIVSPRIAEAGSAEQAAPKALSRVEFAESVTVVPGDELMVELLGIGTVVTLNGQTVPTRDIHR